MTATPAGTWREDNAAWLRRRLDLLRLALQRRVLWLRHQWADDDLRGYRGQVVSDADLDRVLRGGGTSDFQRFLATDPAASALTDQMAVVERGLADETERMRRAGKPPALVAIADLLALSALEVDLLVLAAAAHLSADFGRAFAYVADHAHASYPTLQLALDLRAAADVDRILACDVLTAHATLRRLRLVRCEEVGATGGLMALPIRLEERVLDELRGVVQIDDRVAAFLRRLPGPLLSAEQSNLAEQVACHLREESERWPVVNLVGDLDSGAGGVAAVGCRRTGLMPFLLDVIALADVGVAERREIFALLEREAALSAIACVIDITSWPETEARVRGVVQDLVESVGVPLFIVSSTPWPTTCGALSVHVPRPDRAAQRRLWDAAIAGVAHSVNGEIESIVQRFDLGPSAITAAVASARATAGAEPITGADLWRACRERGGPALDDLAQRLVPAYEWDDLILPKEALDQLHDLASQVEQRGRVYDTWGFGRKSGRGRGISALFAGPSGTGKTMAAEVVARALGLDLYRIDLSGVVSKYIGETEKNLRRVFDAAERSGSILFFDEADALFSSRPTQVRDSHDRYANMEVSYLLQRMEDYDGLAILASNRRASIDTAFLRRLRFIIDFPYPAVEDRIRIWKSVFPAESACEDLDTDFLARLELSGGNIRSIALNAAFLAAAEGISIRMPHVVRAAGREYAKSERPVSAAVFGPYLSMVRA